MTTYIDLRSIGPDYDTAKRRAGLLGLAGKVIGIYLWKTLSYARTGDTVICGPRRLNYWRILPESVALVCAEDLTAQDPLPLRFTNWVEWRLVGLNVPRAEAAALVRNPPKTEKHKRWFIYSVAVKSVEDFPRPASDPPDLEELVSDTSDTEVDEVPYTYQLVDHTIPLALADADLSLAIKNGLTIGIDVETNVVGDEPNEMQDALVGIGVSINDHCYYGYTTYEPWMVLLRNILPKLSWVGHNGKYDLSVLRRHNISPGPLAGDGALAAYLLGEPNARLKDLVYRRMGYRMITYDEVVGMGKKRIAISQADPAIVTRYCCADAYFGVEIEGLLRSELTGKALDLYLDIDLPIAQLLADMQAEGVVFDRLSAAKTLGEVWREQKQLAKAVDMLVRTDGWEREDRTWVCKECRNGKKKRLTCNRCNGMGKFSAPQAINLGSSTQLSDFYHRHQGLPVQKISRETGKPSVDGLALLRMRDNHVSIPLVLSWKRMQKHKEYLIQWLKASRKDGKLHTTYSNVRVRSHRFSSSDPNLQQTKIDWRGDFQAGEGKVLVAADYGQVEVRVGAYASHDPEMLRVVQADPDTEAGDLHGQNVTKLFRVPYDEQKLDHNKPLRTRAKNYMFGAMYGSKGEEVHAVIEKQMLEDPGLAALGIPTVGEIRKGIMGIHDIYGRYFYEWIPFELDKARDQGNIVYTIFGRPRFLPNLTSRDRQEREAAERECISHIIQGTATADVMRMAMLKVKEIPGGRLVINAHDELVSVVEARFTLDATNYKGAMIKAMELGQPFEDVPLVVDATIGRTWKDCHK